MFRTLWFRNGLSTVATEATWICHKPLQKRQAHIYLWKPWNVLYKFYVNGILCGSLIVLPLTKSHRASFFYQIWLKTAVAWFLELHISVRLILTLIINCYRISLRGKCSKQRLKVCVIFKLSDLFSRQTFVNHARKCWKLSKFTI